MEATSVVEPTPIAAEELVEATPVAEAQAVETVAETAPVEQVLAEAVAASTPVDEPAPVEAPAAAPQSKPAKGAKAAKAAPAPLEPVGPDVVNFGDKKAAVRGRRKVRVGRVVSAKMEKTIVVAIASTARHPLYGKIMRRTTKFKVHDETSVAGEGDTVEIMETRPLSKEKRWRVVRVVEKAK